MNELKSEDVMKAIEYCLNTKEYPKCSKCDYITGCKPQLLKLALALLREKDAHIKMLDEDRLGWADEAVKVKMQLNEKDARIEHLEKTMKESILSNTELLENLNKLVEEKDAEIEVLRETNKSLIKVEKEKRRKLWKRCRAKAITEFEEALKALQDPDNPWDTFPVSEEQIAQIANSLKEGLDETNDR